MDVVDLLQSKQRCLHRFLRMSQVFLASAEQGDLSDLETFEQEREVIIRALGMYDRKLTDWVRSLPLAERTPALSRSVQENLDVEAAIVRTILSTDERILACIEREKQRLTREITG